MLCSLLDIVIFTLKSRPKNSIFSHINFTQLKIEFSMVLNNIHIAMRPYSIGNINYIDRLTSDNDFIRCITGENIVRLPDLRRFLNVSKLEISHTNISKIDNLPPNLVSLEIISLPKSLKILRVFNSDLTVLCKLPPNLEKLTCIFNKISSLPSLPLSLRRLDIMSNNLTHLPSLPDELEELYCGLNFLTNLPNAPPKIKKFSCEGNNLPFNNIDDWRKITRLRIMFAKAISKPFLRKSFYSFVKRRKYEIHTELLYNPDIGFYLNSVETLDCFNRA